MKEQFIIIAHLRGGNPTYYGPFDSYHVAKAACKEVRRDFHIPEDASLQIQQLNVNDYKNN